MSLSDDDYATAIAAAAFAIASLENEDSRNHTRTSEGSKNFQTRTKSNKESNGTNISSVSSAAGQDLKSTNEKSAETSYAVHSTTSRQITEEAEQRMMEDGTSSRDDAKNTFSDTGSFQKPPAFSAMHQIEHGNNTLERGRQMSSGEKISSPIKQMPSLPRKVKWDGNLVEYSKLEKADDWENKKLAQIRNRYEKRNASILKWESKKTEKAKHQIEQEEQGLKQRKTKAMQECHDEVVWVDRVANRAKALADERKRNDETKAMKKALAMRSTSKTSPTCFCF